MSYSHKQPLSFKAVPFVPNNDPAIVESGPPLSSSTPRSASGRAPPGVNLSTRKESAPPTFHDVDVSDWRARGPDMDGHTVVTPFKSQFKVYALRGHGVISPGYHAHEHEVVDDRSDSEETLALEGPDLDKKPSEDAHEDPTDRKYLPPGRRSVDIGAHIFSCILSHSLNDPLTTVSHTTAGTDTRSRTKKYVPPPKRVDPVIESYKLQRTVGCHHKWTRGAPYEQFGGSECAGCMKRWAWLYVRTSSDWNFEISRVTNWYPLRLLDTTSRNVGSARGRRVVCVAGSE